MKRFGIVLVCLFFVLFACSPVIAATYDATGDWNFNIFDRYNNCGDSNNSSSGTGTVSQSGNSFSITLEGEFFSGGTINGNVYTLTRSYPEGNGITTETITFNLSSATSGSGSGTWTWVEGQYTCSGGFNLSISKSSSLSPPDYDATGTWYYTTSDNYDSCGEEIYPESGTVSISQSGNTFTFTRGEVTFLGTINGATYTASGSFPEDGGITTTTILFTLSSATTGAGTGIWTWGGQYGCNGGFNVSITKSSSLSPPNYDITGTWDYTISDIYNDCGESDEYESESGSFVFSQSGNNFTISADENGISGTINGATYTASDSYSEDGETTTETVTITLTSPNSGSGMLQWTWSNGSTSCNGGGNISITKKIPEAGGCTDASGTWAVHILSSYSECEGDSISGTHTVVITQQFCSFTFAVGGRTYSGEADSNEYTATATYEEEGGLTEEVISFSVDSANSGSGSGAWKWSAGQTTCLGTYTFSMAKNEGSEGYEYTSGDVGDDNSGGGGGGGGGCFLSILR